MKNEILINAKNTIKNMGWQVVHESPDYEYFTCYNPETKVLLYLQQGAYFGLAEIHTVHEPLKGHGSGWVYEQNLQEITPEILIRAEKFALGKFLNGTEKNISLEKYLSKRIK
ncbi:MAG: hypothetical protein ACRCW1_00535 [Anaerotignaceae bacterium]